MTYTVEGDPIGPVEGVYDVLSDENNAGRHTAVLSLAEGVDNNAALAAILGTGVTVNSFKELVPRMNDIFIKLVTEGI